VNTYSKHLAIAKITDPADVQTECTNRGWSYDQGAIFINIPEIGFEGGNLIYCRYALSFPYIRVQEDWKLWVEPTIWNDNGDQRWIYSGIADCGSDNLSVDTDTQLLIQLLSQVIYANTDGEIHLSAIAADEPFVLGTQLKTWITNTLKVFIDGHTHPVTVDPSSHSGTAAASVAKLTDAPSGVLSTKIFGE
jgi:hypothetical protein